MGRAQPQVGARAPCGARRRAAVSGSVRELRTQAGQTAAEYLGLLLVVAAIVAALATSSVPESIASGVRDAICRIVGTEGCGPAPEARVADPGELTDRYSRAPLEEFLAYRDSADRDPRLDFSTDGCSAPVVGSTGISFDFTDACLRHDFGYRNYKALGRFNAEKERVDRRFYEDMVAHCRTRSVLLRGACMDWARRFYAGVRVFG